MRRIEELKVKIKTLLLEKVAEVGLSTKVIAEKSLERERERQRNRERDTEIEIKMETQEKKRSSTPK